jgi:hypothetical protein
MVSSKFGPSPSFEKAKGSPTPERRGSGTPHGQSESGIGERRTRRASMTRRHTREKDGKAQTGPSTHLSDNPCELRGSMQHLLVVYSPESEILESFSGVDLSAALLCPAPIENSRTGQSSLGSIVVGACSCFRSYRAARDCEDRRSRLSHS